MDIHALIILRYTCHVVGTGTNLHCIGRIKLVSNLPSQDIEPQTRRLGRNIEKLSISFSLFSPLLSYVSSSTFQ